MKKLLLFFTVALILGSCASTSEFIVTRAGEEPEESTGRILYALPRTILEVRVDFEKETYIPGPYRRYSERFLGIKPVITETGFSYHINDAKLKADNEPDPDQYFSINLTEGDFDNSRFLELSQKGFILNPYKSFTRENENSNPEALPGEPYFTDLSVKRNLAEVTDTMYKTMITDSSYVQIPIVRKQREAKTLEQKAEEAANFIIKIRKRRFKLLAGQYDVFPEGDALAISVEELDKLEKEYLELFLGKTIKQQFTRSYVIVPDEGKDESKYVLAHFSQQTGLHENDDKEGNPLVLEIRPQNNLSSLGSAGYPDVNLKNNLYYRVPDVAVVELRIATEILYESRMSLYQAGEVVNLPVSK